MRNTLLRSHPGRAVKDPADDRITHRAPGGDQVPGPFKGKNRQARRHPPRFVLGRFPRG